jgi:hypothetical protein
VYDGSIDELIITFADLAIYFRSRAIISIYDGKSYGKRCGSSKPVVCTEKNEMSTPQV